MRSHKTTLNGRPLSAEVALGFKRQMERFREKFGRDPAPNDPIFFNPDADQPEPMTERQIEGMQRDMRQAALNTGGIPARRCLCATIVDENCRVVEVS